MFVKLSGSKAIKGIGCTSYWSRPNKMKRSRRDMLGFERLSQDGKRILADGWHTIEGFRGAIKSIFDLSIAKPVPAK